MRMNGTIVAAVAGIVVSLGAEWGTMHYQEYTGYTYPIPDWLRSWLLDHGLQELIYHIGPFFESWLWYVVALIFGIAVALTAPENWKSAAAGAVGYTCAAGIFGLVFGGWCNLEWAFWITIGLSLGLSVAVVLFGAWLGNRMRRPTTR